MKRRNAQTWVQQVKVGATRTEFNSGSNNVLQQQKHQLTFCFGH